MVVGTIKVRTEPCVGCGESSEILVPKLGHWRWLRGDLIQDAFPDMPEDQRELLKSGIHPACWDEMFGGNFGEED